MAKTQSKTVRRAKGLRETQFQVDTLTNAARRFTRGLTPERVATVFESAKRRIDDQIVLAHEMEESDDHLRGTLKLRRAAVLRLETNVESGDPDNDRANEAADAARTMVDQPWFHQLSAHLLRAAFTQWSAAEVLYDLDGGGFTPVGFRPVEFGRFDFDAQANLRFHESLLRTGQFIEPMPGQFVVHGVETTAVPGDFALVRSVGLLYLLARLDLKQWGTMIDQWGIPVIDFEYEAGKSTQEIQDIVDELLALAGRRIIAHPAGTTVNTTELPEQTPHEAAQNFIRRAMSRLLIGQDSSQMAIEGQKTGATLQGNVRDDIRDEDALALDAAINTSLLAPWCAWNYGPDVPPPRVKRCVRETKDPVQRGGVFKIARELGLPLIAAQVYTDLGIEMPEGTPEILSPTMAAWLVDEAQSQGALGHAGSKAGGETPAQPKEPLSGIQITSAIDVLGKVTDETLSPDAAGALLEALGFEAETAKRIVGGQKIRTKDVSVDDLTFKREMVKLWIADGTIGDVIYNATDIEQLLTQVNVATEQGYEEPWLPVQTPDGGVVTGDPLKDKAGDIVGSEITPNPNAPAGPGGLGSSGLSGGPPASTRATAPEQPAEETTEPASPKASDETVSDEEAVREKEASQAARAMAQSAAMFNALDRNLYVIDDNIRSLSNRIERLAAQRPAQQPFPESTLSGAAELFGGMFTGHSKAIRTLAETIAASDGTDTEKAAEFKRRLPEVFDELKPRQRAALLHKATLAAIGRGSLQVHEETKRPRDGETT